MDVCVYCNVGFGVLERRREVGTALMHDGSHGENCFLRRRRTVLAELDRFLAAIGVDEDERAATMAVLSRRRGRDQFCVAAKAVVDRKLADKEFSPAEHRRNRETLAAIGRLAHHDFGAARLPALTVLNGRN